MDDLRFDAPPDGGLREHNRTERRARIREAARAVFCRRGYQSATTREIAALARVANGTLFRYASNKRELLLMIINDDLDDLTEQRQRAPARKGHDLREQIMEFYRPRYEYFARYPLLSRPFVSEAFHFMSAHPSEVGPEARRNRARRAELLADLQDIFERAAGQGRRPAPPKLLAELVHAVYLSANRQWLESSTLDPVAGLKRLDGLLRLAAGGFERAPERAKRAAAPRRRTTSQSLRRLKG